MMKTKRMNKKGKRAFFLLLLATAVYLLIPKSRTVYGISDGGAYHMVVESEELLAPWIWFDISEKAIQFTSSLDERISLTTSGTVEFLHGKGYAVSEDREQIWIFEVIDNDTIEFVAEGSTIPFDSEGNAILFDGAQFKRIDK